MKDGELALRLVISATYAGRFVSLRVLFDSLCPRLGAHPPMPLLPCPPESTRVSYAVSSESLRGLRRTRS
jgi:hypothetical protein